MRWIPVAIASFLLAGCASRPSLAGGEWIADISGQEANLRFETNGSMKMSIPLPIGSLGSTGTFSETDTSVSFTIQHIDLPDLPIPGGAGKLVEGMIGRPVTFNVEWVGDNEVRLTPQIAAGPFNQAMSLKRKAK
jgi:hypothetical protein